MRRFAISCQVAARAHRTGIPSHPTSPVFACRGFFPLFTVTLVFLEIGVPFLEQGHRARLFFDFVLAVGAGEVAQQTGTQGHKLPLFDLRLGHLLGLV